MAKRTGPRFRILLILIWVCLVGAVVARAEVRPPTGQRDLILLIGQYQPHLYRLVGQQPVPFGTAQFYSPQAIVADTRQKCFYVFDEPKLTSGTDKIWRIEADGTARIIFQTPTSSQGGPFSTPTSLAVDRHGRLLIADVGRGLWCLGANGRLERLFDGKNKPLYRISAATDSRWGLILATSYLYEITGGQMLDLPKRTVGALDQEFVGFWTPTPTYSTGDGYGNISINDTPTVPLSGTGVGNSTGRQVPIRIWKNQGGLYLVDPQDRTPQIRHLMVNQKPGSQEYDTYWRTAGQILEDAAGRVVLVDAGSIWKRSEEVYTGSSGATSYSHQRKTTSDIYGGLFVLHPNGQFEDLTFKTADGKLGPLRHPRGVAQWSDDTYLLADPKMYVKGISGTGGLFLLKLDGSRQARWPFGQRLRPVGVAVLRDAGPPAQATPTRQIRLADLAGTRAAGPITRITSVSWECKPQGGGGIMGSVGMNWEARPAAQAEAKLRTLFENARWMIGPDGALLFCGHGVTPQTQGNPLVMQGTVTAHEGMLSVSASYKTQSMFDTQLGSIDARLYGAEPGTVRLDMTVNVFTKTERLKGSFEQTMSLQGN